MEKKIEVEIDGRKVRIMPHMLKDAGRFGATQTKRQIKEPPKELGEMKKIILPPKLKIPEPEAKADELPVEELPVEEVKELPKVKRTRTKK